MQKLQIGIFPHLFFFDVLLGLMKLAAAYELLILALTGAKPRDLGLRSDPAGCVQSHIWALDHLKVDNRL